MQITREQKEWLRWSVATSIPLRKLSADGGLLEIASGCLVTYGGRKFILSVSHAVSRDSQGWALELGADSQQGTEMYWPNAFLYMGEMQKGSAVLRELDFCFAEIANDVQSIYAHRTPISVSDERPRHVFSASEFSEPSAVGMYAFAGEVKPEIHGAFGVVTEMNVYPGLRFIRQEGRYLLFKLPVEHPGHVFFRGCSGAPIVDMDRKVVALVCNGNDSSGEIRGIAISAAVRGLQWYCDMRNAAES